MPGGKGYSICSASMVIYRNTFVNTLFDIVVVY